MQYGLGIAYGRRNAKQTRDRARHPPDRDLSRPAQQLTAARFVPRVQTDLENLPDDFDRDALLRAVGVFNAIVAHPEKVRMAITSDFVAAVRKVYPDAEYAEAYEQDRPLGVAMAKTIPQEDGSVDLIVDSRVFHVDAPPGSADATFKHEAHHVAMSERGETLSDVRLRRQDEPLPVHPDLLAMAGVACEEFRVEALLRSTEEPGHIPWVDQVETQARTFYEVVETACNAYQTDLDVAAVARAVLNVFHGLATSSAYVAAELFATGRATAALSYRDEIETLVLGEAWRGFITALQQLPLADAPTERSELDAMSFSAAVALDKCLRSIGFTVTVPPGGGTDFRILDPRQWWFGWSADL